MAWYLNETQVGHLLCVRVTAVDVRDRRAGIGDCRGYLDAGVFPDERDRAHERGGSALTDSLPGLVGTDISRTDRWKSSSRNQSIAAVSTRGC